MTNAASIKAQLKNEAQEQSKTLQDILTIYGLERTIYRLSISKYAKNFTLKGGIFLYALFDGNYSRSTLDIDLLANKTSNTIENMRNIFSYIFSIEVNDAINFDLGTLKAEEISASKKISWSKHINSWFLGKNKNSSIH